MTVDTKSLVNSLEQGAQEAFGEGLADLVRDDLLSDAKTKMRQGISYYACKHDVLNKNFAKTKISETVYDATGETAEQMTAYCNPNRSNHHNVNPFHRILVDQKVGYLVGKEPTVWVNGAEKEKKLEAYQKKLREFCNEEFNRILQQLLVDAANCGFGVLHVYYDKKGKFRYTAIPPLECIPVYDTEYEQDLVGFIRYYTVEEIHPVSRRQKKYLEWWTENEVAYYIEQENGKFTLDIQKELNPAPHWQEFTFSDGAELHRKAHGFGRVPFLVLKNNHSVTTDLEPVKGLIDAYDLISSEGTNNLLDLVELYWVIAGYGGETAGAIAKKLQINKAVNISDSNGSVEAKQVELPVDGRLAWLKMLKQDIFHFGQGIDLDAEKFGNAQSGVALKFQYGALDLKCAPLAVSLKALLRGLFTFVTESWNRVEKENYSPDSIAIAVNKVMIGNDAELVSMITASRGLVSDKTLLAKHPFVEDVNEELQEMRKDEPGGIV